MQQGGNVAAKGDVGALVRMLLGSPTFFQDTLQRARGLTDLNTTELHKPRMETMAVVIIDSGGRIQWANKVYQKLTGYSLAELETKPPWAVLGDLHEAARSLDRIMHVIEGDAPTRGPVTYHVRHRDGRVTAVAFTAKVVHDSDGRRIVGIGTVVESVPIPTRVMQALEG